MFESRPSVTVMWRAPGPLPVMLEAASHRTPPRAGTGLREIYHPTYYGAFVLDPNGDNVEAVCHTPV
jgi:hypothetical protein